MIESSRDGLLCLHVSTMRIRKNQCVSCSSFAIHVGSAMQLRSAEGFVLMFPKLGDLGVPPKNYRWFIDGFSWIFHCTSIQLLGYPYGNPARVELRLVVAFSDARLLARLVFYGDLSEGEEREAKIATVALQVDSCWQDFVYVYVWLCMFMYVYCTHIQIKMYGY